MEQKSVQMWIAGQAALQHLLDDAIKSKFKACRCGLGTIATLEKICNGFWSPEDVRFTVNVDARVLQKV